MNHNTIEQVKSIKLLGTFITDDLKWNKKHTVFGEEGILKNGTIEANDKVHNIKDIQITNL